MTEAERIVARELDHIAWSISDMVLTAARDDQPSPAALALLAIVTERAPAPLRTILQTQGFSAYTHLIPERAALWDHTKAVTAELARAYLDQLTAPQAGRNRPQGAMKRPGRIDLAKITERACMGLKTALAGGTKFARARCSRPNLPTHPRAFAFWRLPRR